jgi:hypothetical protein
MNVVIAGGRDFTNTTLVFNKLKNLLNTNDVIISGHASGADKIGETYARTYKMQVKLFPAEWDKYGKSAGPIRNRKMAEVADLVIVFWDLESRGTKSMIKETLRLNKKLLVFDYSGTLIEPEKLKKLL